MAFRFRFYFTLFFDELKVIYPINEKRFNFFYLYSYNQLSFSFLMFNV